MAIPSKFNSTNLKHQQSRNNKIQTIYDKLNTGNYVQSFVLENDIVHKVLARRGRPTLKLPYISSMMTDSLLEAYHDSVISGHFGINKTLYKIQLLNHYERNFSYFGVYNIPTLFPKPIHQRTTLKTCDKVKDAAVTFYTGDDISWQAPGKCDYVVVRDDGQKTKHQKHISISKSTFQELRPRFVLYKSTLAHRICICVYHENIHLLINVLSKHVTGLKAGDLSAFTSMLICDIICSGSGGDVGFSFGLVSNNTTHDKFSVATCLDVIVNEIKSYVPDVNEIIFFSDGAASQFKNRFLLRYLTYMMDDNDVDIIWNFFARSHGKGVVDGIGGILKRLVWSEMMAGKRCTSASDFVQICNEKTKIIIAGEITNAQIDVTIAKLSHMFDQTCSVPVIRKQHSIKVLHKNIIECSSYTNCTQTFVFTFE
ncbi:unnamed protein product [Didymodactylos carnosus]|uniref:Integrase zinc-binding domain-containing protein n=1 Tax=Didymodactylos carnosus TaxID=1234261 RepID=A0A8S2DMP6_9BILA|nr:unnamed protein product [Didymodactylos carnosus]CAF3724929.1 unnamed protein product [Didymodactylos carnosus]